MTGHAEFDKKFEVRAAAPGDVSIISAALAEAHAAGEVPLWRLRGRELTFWTSGRIRPDRLDGALSRTLRVAELLAISA
jgi:hypothetical protein